MELDLIILIPDCGSILIFFSFNIAFSCFTFSFNFVFSTSFAFSINFAFFTRSSCKIFNLVFSKEVLILVPSIDENVGLIKNSFILLAVLVSR